MDQLSISPLEFFNQAGSVGKTVILILLLASIWCWALIIEGVVNAVRFGKALRQWRDHQPSPLLELDRRGRAGRQGARARPRRQRDAPSRRRGDESARPQRYRPA